MIFPFTFTRICIYLTMGHHQIRSDKTCLNCGATVDHRYCGSCGQENVETRQTFLGLFVHFAEDLTHYEGKFWMSLKYLLGRPAFLTTSYLQGKRTSYFPPVRLYIFVSFVTFLLPHLIPEPYKAPTKEEKEYMKTRLATLNNKPSNDFAYESNLGIVIRSQFATVEELDSAYFADAQTDLPMERLEYWRHKKAIELKEYTPMQLQSMFVAALSSTFPKVLFVYMPLFALVIGLFHRGKQWYYFDHAIFTLHYFSYLLLVFTSVSLLSVGLDWLDHFYPNQLWFNIDVYMLLAMIAWYAYYFYRGHYLFYRDQTLMSLTKASAILVINFMVFLLVFTGRDRKSVV